MSERPDHEVIHPDTIHPVVPWAVAAAAVAIVVGLFAAVLGGVI